MRNAKKSLKHCLDLKGKIESLKRAAVFKDDTSKFNVMSFVLQFG